MTGHVFHGIISHHKPTNFNKKNTDMQGLIVDQKWFPLKEGSNSL